MTIYEFYSQMLIIEFSIDRAEMSGTSSGGGVGGSLRPLRTRRPYTPREPQRSLFTDASKKEPRPPSSYEYVHLFVVLS